MLRSLLVFVILSTLNTILATTITNDDKKFIIEQLKQHNKIRKLHGVDKLELNLELCGYAQIEAKNSSNPDSNRKTRPEAKFSKPTINTIQYGENICTLSTDKNKSATYVWYEKRHSYNYTYPSTNSRGQDSEMFTQIIWKSTKQVGFGRINTLNGNHMVVVAIYYPPGNNRINAPKIYRENVFEPTALNENQEEEDYDDIFETTKEPIELKSTETTTTSLAIRMATTTSAQMIKTEKPITTKLTVTSSTSSSILTMASTRAQAIATEQSITNTYTTTTTAAPTIFATQIEATADATVTFNDVKQIEIPSHNQAYSSAKSSANSLESCFHFGILLVCFIIF